MEVTAYGPWWQISCRQCSAKLCRIDGRGIYQQSLAGLQAHGAISLFCKDLFLPSKELFVSRCHQLLGKVPS